MAQDFTPLEQAAWGDLLGMHGRLMRRIDADLQERHRISHAEFEVLLRLSWEADRRLRIQDLAARSLLTRSGISRVVDRLAQAGLVTREGANEDRRGTYAVLTEAGLTRFHEAMKSHVNLVHRYFLSLFNESELSQMAEFWQRVLKREEEEEASHQ